MIESKKYRDGSGGGSVGRAVASDTRDPWSHHLHPFCMPIINIIEKSKIKKKEARNGPSSKKSTEFQIHAHCPLRLRMKHLFISCRSRFFFYDSCFQSCFENLLSNKLRNLIGGFKHDGVDLMTTTMTTASLI